MVGQKSKIKSRINFFNSNYTAKTNKIVMKMMKGTLNLILFIVMILSISACSNNMNNAKNENQDMPNQTTSSESENDSNEDIVEGQNDEESSVNILIVYFSRVGSSTFDDDVDVVASASLIAGDSGLIGNTEVIAEIMREKVGGDLYQIITVDPYPSDYDETTDLAMQEQKANARPALATRVENMDEYDVIFLGYPNWWGTIPMAMFTFLEEYDFSGKIIVLFSTHEGSRFRRSIQDISDIAPKATILDGLIIRGRDVQTDRTREAVMEWLRDLEMIEMSD